MKQFIVRVLTWVAGSALAALPAWAQADLQGAASVNGTVTSSAPFQAAKVFFRNNEKRMQYMVYTAGGKYQALHLFPGDYEMRVEARGLVSPVTRVTLKAGANTAPAVALKAVDTTGTQIVTMDELFPPGAGRKFMVDHCLGCHSPDMFGARAFPAVAWGSYVDMMQKGGNIQGFASPQEREELIEYLGKNFGPDARKRAVNYDKPVPLNEAVLAKAMYIEYYFKPNDDPSMKRRGQDPHFDQQGNVWVTDRNIPNRITRLDPRSGAWKEWLLPHPEGDIHGLTIDREGVVWIPGRIGKRKDKDGIQLIAFDPKTEKFEQFPVNPGNKITDRLQSHTPIVDGQGNVWATMIGGDRFYKWNKQTRTVEMIGPTPTRPSAPYGIDMDSQGNIWMALFRGAPRVGKWDPKAQQFSEFPALTTSGRMSRASVDLNDRVWYGIHDRGVVGVVDPKSGQVTEFKPALNLSRPYDPQADYEGNVWFGDDGQGGTIIRLDPRTRAFSYYPAPQVADMPKIEITRDGAIWYCPRSGAEPGVGVLYPDMTKVKTLAAFYIDFDPASSRQALRNQQNRSAAR
jgi:virginiamycin B lyase